MPQASSGINFGDLGFYSGGFNLPEGNYCLFFDVRMHAGTKQDGSPAGPERLGVMIQAWPIDEKGTKQADEPHEKFLSMGSKAHQTYAPNPDTGKGLVLVPGGPGAQPNNSTNWALFLKSLYDSGMPQGVFTNDLTTVDGVWVHTQNVPEPEERKGFGNATGEVEQEKRKGSGTIPIVTAILDGGKPWEGTGGLSDAAVAKTAAKPAPKAAPKVGPKAVQAKAAPAAEVDEESIKMAALDALSKVLGKEENANGMAKLVLRTSIFSTIKEASGEDAAKQVAESYTQNDTTFGALLAEVGFKIAGMRVVPIA